ncbi:MAG: sugar ABC transporter permease [Sphingomonas sp. 28-66-16]|nr:MAG: sugar ABC transporter permease [Sphingomonas sp. 28-66-16]
MTGFNWHGIAAIYRFELARFGRTILTSLLTPVITTALYFVVFGSAIGSKISTVDGVPYGAFIVPGLIMLSMLTEGIGNASFGIYMPKWSGTIYELLSAPISPFETVIAYVGAAATKSMILGMVIFGTAHLFVALPLAHPVAMVGFMLLTAITFCLFGFVLGIWAKSFEQLQIVPLLVVTPLTFLGGTFYSIKMLPDAWQTVTLFNPIVYLISGFRWTFFGQGDVAIGWSLVAIGGFLAVSLATIAWIFRTGYRLKS